MEFKVGDKVICRPGKEDEQNKWPLKSGVVYTVRKMSLYGAYFEEEPDKFYYAHRFMVIDPATLTRLEKALYNIE
jgi:hypothetical protein